MKEKIKILVCCHKPGLEIPKNDVYMPIQCGKAISKYDLGIQGDNTGDNISEKNPYYCELTALYWAWKNLKDIDYIGLCHYRRYFNPKPSFYLQRESIELQKLDNRIMDIFPMLSSLSYKDIIVPIPMVMRFSLSTQYRLGHVSEDLDILRMVVAEKYPDYIYSYDYIMTQTNKFCAYNMFLTRKDIFDNYCKWLFDILFTVEKRIHISAYSYQQRVLGFMAERLLNVYVYHHQLKKEYHQIFYIDEKANTSTFLKYWSRRIYCDLLFYLNFKK